SQADENGPDARRRRRSDRRVLRVRRREIPTEPTTQMGRSHSVRYASMSFQMLVAHPTACCPHSGLGPGASFCSICTTLPSAIREVLAAAIGWRSLAEV